MLGSHLIQSGFNNNAFAAGKERGFKPAFLNNFSSHGKSLGQNKADQASTPTQAGQVMLTRLVSSVESRFTATRLAAPTAAPVGDVSQDFSPEAVSDRILGFVKDRLQKEKANGASEERLQQLFDQAKEGIEKGFGEARDIIMEQGLFTDEVKDDFLATVSKTQQGLNELEDSLFGGQAASVVSEPAVASQSVERAAVATEAVYYNQKRSFDMQVKTQDGDVVTIKVNGEESLSSGSYSAVSNDGAVNAFAADYSNSSRFSFSVEGELDEGELSALNDLFAQVNDVADDFYKGDIDAAFNEAMDVGYDASELAGFAVNMRRTEVVAVRQTYAEVAQYGEPEAAPVNPFQGMMDKLADFSAKVQQAQADLMQAGSKLPDSDQLYSQLLKELAPEKEPMDKTTSTPDQSSGKQAFEDFIEALTA